MNGGQGEGGFETRPYGGPWVRPFDRLRANGMDGLRACPVLFYGGERESPISQPPSGYRLSPV